MTKMQTGVLGVFAHMDTLIDAIGNVKGSEYGNAYQVFSPCPRHEIEEAIGDPVSPVRRFTLFGGLLGCAIGYLFSSYASLDWILPTSGKPIVAPVAFTVVAFELTILFGAIFTILGIVLNGRLFRKSNVLTDPRFTDDKFGIFVGCSKDEYEKVSKLLTDRGAEEVKRAE